MGESPLAVEQRRFQIDHRRHQAGVAEVERNNRNGVFPAHAGYMRHPAPVPQSTSREQSKTLFMKFPARSYVLLLRDTD